MRHDDNAYLSWLWGQFLLLALLGASLALFVAYPSLRSNYSLPELRLFIDTAIMVAAALVAVLAGVRFSVEGRRLDLLLCCGFFVLCVGNLSFGIAPTLGGHALRSIEAWAATWSRLLGWSLIAAAPFVHGRISARERALETMIATCALALALIWGIAYWVGSGLPPLAPAHSHQQPFLLTAALALQALVHLCAGVGFGLRYRSRGQDLDRWLALGATLMLFASLHYVFTPLLAHTSVSQGDFLRVLGYAVLLVGVWRAIRHAEFGRAVAEERARVAREIHDGLAQYLFAVSTHATMLEGGAPLETTVPKLKEAATAAQQEARFAILALSSASGSAPFDAAIRRYVEFLTADGALEVELDIDPGIRLAPDEQIEVFRIVQEGLANARKHARAERADVWIGERGGQRVVRICDDGEGFEVTLDGGGQGLRNIRARTESIGGGLRLDSKPGRGTALEVTLRT